MFRHQAFYFVHLKLYIISVIFITEIKKKNQYKRCFPLKFPC